MRYAAIYEHRVAVARIKCRSVARFDRYLRIVSEILSSPIRQFRLKFQTYHLPIRSDPSAMIAYKYLIVLCPANTFTACDALSPAPSK